MSSEISGREKKEFSPEAVSFKDNNSKHQKQPHPTSEQMLYSRGTYIWVRLFSLYMSNQQLARYFYFLPGNHYLRVPSLLFCYFSLLVRRKTELHADRNTTNHCAVQWIQSRHETSLKKDTHAHTHTNNIRQEGNKFINKYCFYSAVCRCLRRSVFYFYPEVLLEVEGEKMYLKFKVDFPSVVII